MTSVNFDRASHFYDATRGFPPEVAPHIGNFLANSGGLTPQDTVLEIGIGTGRIALPLAPFVGSITGVDISRNMMLRLREKQNGESIHLAEGDALRLPFPDNTFDVGVIVHVLHLVSDPIVVLSELQRVLKPDAKLLHCRGRVRGIFDELNAAWQGSKPETLPMHKWETVNALLPENGWHAIGDYQYPYTLLDTPGDYLDKLKNRIWSATWALSDEDHAHSIEAVKTAIAQHYDGDYDRKIENPTAFMVNVYTPPVS
jgi:ubiquinone/menaquinone biosynthesis C-methylase UbiE